MRIIILTLLPIVMNLVMRAETPGNEVTCNEIGAVRRIPFHAGESVNDDAYNKLLQKSWAVVPCLIGQITNTHRTPDPRSASIFGDVRVGDVAFWVIKDITGLPYDQMFPPNLVARFPNEGVYAYFDWVHKPGNRKMLQKKVLEWYRLHQPNTARPLEIYPEQKHPDVSSNGDLAACCAPKIRGTIDWRGRPQRQTMYPNFTSLVARKGAVQTGRFLVFL